MNHNREHAPTPAPEQAPIPGSLRAVDQRLEAAFTMNLGTMNDTTGKVSEQDRGRSNERLARIYWQQNMIESLRSRKIYEAGNESTFSDAEEQASRLSADEALTYLEDWMQKNLSDLDKDPDDVIYRAYAEDLRSKLIDEASRS